jgi:hypothetical protein
MQTHFENIYTDTKVQLFHVSTIIMTMAILFIGLHRILFAIIRHADVISSY